MAALARSLALAAGAAFVAGSVQPAHEESIVADDSECDASAEHCGLNALQRRATRVGESRDDEPVAASAWGQCGGKLWKGTTSCVPGYRCRVKDEWYSQCVPGGGAVPASPSVQGMSSGAGDDDGDDSDEADGEDEEEDGEAPGEGQEDDEGQEDEGEEDESEEDDAAAGLTANPATPEPKRYESLSPIVVKGNYLYDSATGKRFFAKGTSYNPRMDTFNPNGRSKGKPCKPGNARTMGYTVDVIADDREQRWSEDLKAIANLGANTIRLFNVDPGQDHSKFMKAAESYGIYVIVPLNGKDYGFLPAFPSPSCYTMNMTWEVANGDGTTRPYGNVGVNVLTYGKQIVKQFSKFPNTLFFTVNNEFAMNDKNGFAGFQCVKALTRDIHRYQKSCGASMRRVPLIYSDYDMGPPDRGIVARYLTCALESEDDAIDVYGLNVYSYCEKAYPGDGKKDNFQYSPYIEIQKDFKDFSVPVLFTEFGCVEGDFLSFCPYKGGRTWPDVKYFFSKELGEILSGAIAYTYEQDYEERGMVLTPGFLNGQNKLHLLDNYYTLQKQFAKYHVSTKWDGAEITNCKWTPGDAAKQQYKHQQPTCPSSKMGREVQKRRRVEEVTDWHELPPSPSAPLSDVGGQSECPADEVPAPLEAEAKCHFDESSA